MMPEWRGMFKMDATDGAGSTTDYSQYITNVDAGFNRDLTDYFTIDSIDAKTSPGGRTWEMKITVLADSPLATALITWTTAVTRTVEYGEPDRTTPGSRTLTGEFFAGSISGAYKAVGGSAAPRVMDVTLKPSGGLTPAVVP